MSTLPRNVGKIEELAQKRTVEILEELLIINNSQLRLEAARIVLREEYQNLLALLLRIRNVSKDPSPQNSSLSEIESECKTRLSETSQDPLANERSSLFNRRNRPL